MGQRNMHMIDLDSDLQGQDYTHRESCTYYDPMANFPQPSVQTVPTPGNSSNFNLGHLPEHHEGGLFYCLPQYNQYPVSNHELAVAPSSNPYNPYVPPPPCAPRDFPIQVSHGTHDQLSLSGSHRMVGVPADSYVNPYMEGVRGSSKRKNAEGLPWNVQYCDTLDGSSSSVALISARPLESDATVTDPVPFVPNEFRGNETSSIIGSGPQRSTSNRSGFVASDSVLAHNSNHSIQANFVGQPYQLPGNPWLGIDLNTYSWNQAPTLPYVHGGMTGGAMEVSNMGLQGYQMTGGSAGFLHTPIPQGRPNIHHQSSHLQGLRGHNMNFSSQLVASSRRFSTNSTIVGPFPGVVEAGARYLGPVPPSGFRVYRPHRREITSETNTRHRNLPHLRVLPEDGVAILEVPGYHEAGEPMDQHRELRLDIDDMSYEELLALGEQIGHVVTGLSEEAITTHLKTRSFNLSATWSSLDEAPYVTQEVNFCVICQNDYKAREEIGTLDCGHEYHLDCIKKWLLVKNTCPICKSTALSAGGKEL